MDKGSAIAKLLRSSNPTAQFLGATALLLFFLPSVFDAIDAEDLSVWQRLKHVTFGASQSLAVIVMAASKWEDDSGDSDSVS